jgi:ribosomal protein L11 methyltransferase
MAWLEITLTVPRADVVPASELLSTMGALAVTLRDASQQALFATAPGDDAVWDVTRVTGLFHDDTDTPRLLERLRNAWDPQPFPHCEVSQLKEQEWTRAWMSAFTAQRFGARLWVRPSWEVKPQRPLDPNAGVVDVVLDPGLAFGTGTHATTALCLEWLEAAALCGRCLIDYGCGSGILAIAAAKLGVGHAFAVDHDPLALQATRDNAVRNRVDGRVSPVAPQTLPRVSADILVANILAQPLVKLAQVFAGLVRPSGWIVLSGILQDEADGVIDAYRQWFEVDPPVARDEWVRIVGQRKPLNR